MSNLLPTTTVFNPTIAVPDNAPVMPDWASNPRASFDDALPSRYFSLEGLTEWCEERGAESRVLTVQGITCELLYDPEVEDASAGEWKPCLAFEETPQLLVINKSRGKMLKRMTGSPLLARWGGVGQVVIEPGIFEKNAQIVIDRIPAATQNGNGKSRIKRQAVSDDYTMDDANGDLF